MTVEVPRVVTIDRCHVDPSPLPDVPPSREVERCEREFGAGALCFDPGNAHRMHALLQALGETWRAVRDCAEGAQ